MAFSANQLIDRLSAMAGDKPPLRLLVAFSGGMDSTVLLHALSTHWSSSPLCALHVDHGLHRSSGVWARSAKRCAERFGIDCVVREVAVTADGSGPEASARSARYRVFAAELNSGDWLLTAHHQDDQAETFLLNALRGSGVRGLAGMPASRSCGAGLLLRPLLAESRSDLAAYAHRHKLQWIDDPANEDEGFDRNLLRHRVLPPLRERWAHATAKLARSADLARRDSALLDEVAAQDSGGSEPAERMDRRIFDRLSPPRQRNLLRYALRRLGLPPAPATALQRVTDELLPAPQDAEPIVSWPGAEVRRYRDRIYLMATLPNPDALPSGRLTVDTALELGNGLGCLRLQRDANGIDPALASRGFEVRFRQGGERLRVDERGGSRKLKTLLQEAAIVPWMRSRVPLLVQGDRLVAVGDLWTSFDALVPDGYVVNWESRPTLR